MTQITVAARVAWWLRWYLAGVYMVALTTGRWPDDKKLTAMTVRALRLRVVPDVPVSPPQPTYRGYQPKATPGACTPAPPPREL